MLAYESAWYADSDGIVIGTILLDKTDKDWNYVILGRDERGDFRWIDGNSSFSSQEDTTDELVAKMQEHVDTGETVFPQGD